jgi:basic amino acid/polyamine antiporter, APA family
MTAEKTTLFVREATGLTRQIGAFDAFLGNILAMGVSYFFVFAYFTSGIFPGANLPATVFVTLIPGVIVALLYYLFTVAMPRTGGDYVWTSRILSPSIGFMTNFVLSFTWLTSIAFAVGWGITYGIAPMFAGLGIVENNATYSSWAVTLSSPTNGFIISAILIILFILPIILGTRPAFRLMAALFIIALVGTVVMVAAFFSTPNSTFVANFNHLSGMNYANTISSAGLPLGFTLSATIFGSIFTMTNFLGFFSSSYFAGEVRRVARTQVIAMFGSLLFLMAIGILVYSSVYYSVGSDFLNAMSATFGLSSYTLSQPPVLNFLVAFASPNPYVIILSGVALLATGLGGATLFSFVIVRNMFAWSFDRVAPSALTKLDSRRGSPYVAVIAMTILALFMAAIYYFTNLLSYYLFATLNLFIVFILVSIAAILFPFRLKSVFNSAPGWVSKKIGGVPFMTILGVIGVIVNAYFAYATASPTITPVPGGLSVQILAYSTVPLTIIVAFVLYGISYAVRSSQGIRLGLAFKEIPPE